MKPTRRWHAVEIFVKGYAYCFFGVNSNGSILRCSPTSPRTRGHWKTLMLSSITLAPMKLCLCRAFHEPRCGSFGTSIVALGHRCQNRRLLFCSSSFLTFFNYTCVAIGVLLMMFAITTRVHLFEVFIFLKMYPHARQWRRLSPRVHLPWRFIRHETIHRLRYLSASINELEPVFEVRDCNRWRETQVLISVFALLLAVQTHALVDFFSQGSMILTGCRLDLEAIALGLWTRFPFEFWVVAGIHKVHCPSTESTNTTLQRWENGYFVSSRT